MGQRAYCSQDHPCESDQEADQWCEMYHRPNESLERRFTGVELPDYRPWTALDGNHDPAPTL